MISSDISPDTGNLYFGAGYVKWWELGATEWRHLGEVLSFEFTLGVVMREHMSKMAGTRFRDYSGVQQTTGTMKMGLQEFTSDNLKMALLGIKTPAIVGVSGTPGAPASISIGAKPQLVGFIRFLGTNDIGPRQQVDLPAVLITPSSPLNFLADDWGVMELSGDVRGNSSAIYGTHYANIDAEVVTGDPT